MNKTWQIQNKRTKDIVDALLENRGIKAIKEKKEFFEPKDPMKIRLLDIDIDKKEIKKAEKRIQKAIKNKEGVIVYGDYDADGVTATAIMWEVLFDMGVDVLPYIPDRFEEGYGINTKSIEKLKLQNPNLKLIVTVDNGIVANVEIQKIKKAGIDVIITDHHEAERKKPEAYAIIHTKKICGSALAWIVARELTNRSYGLELAGIGTIADQMPLTGANRSFAKFGIEAIKKTKRLGLIELLREAVGEKENIGTYVVNYIIAPRINAMGRMGNALESLRLLCTKDRKRAKKLAALLNKTNLLRQDEVEKMIKSTAEKMENYVDSIIFLSDKTYHEGVIGLAAGRLVEEFWRPSIVVSIGEKISKGSARSINGFNMIEAIRAQSDLLVAHGGHMMAAGFTIETEKIEDFRKRISKSAKIKLTKEILARKLRIDCELDFGKINWDLAKKIKEFEPTGLGNPSPTFVTYGVQIADVKFLGKDKKHLKLKLGKEGKFFDAIGFSMAAEFSKLQKGDHVDVVYKVEENEWNGVNSLQLNLKGLRALLARQ